MRCVMKKLLAGTIAGLGLMAGSCAFGADARWVKDSNANMFYSDGGNWDTFSPASGPDSSAVFYYNPTFNDIAANINNDIFLSCIPADGMDVDLGRAIAFQIHYLDCVGVLRRLGEPFGIQLEALESIGES